MKDNGSSYDLVFNIETILHICKYIMCQRYFSFFSLIPVIFLIVEWLHHFLSCTGCMDWHQLISLGRLLTTFVSHMQTQKIVTLVHCWSNRSIVRETKYATENLFKTIVNRFGDFFTRHLYLFNVLFRIACLHRFYELIVSVRSVVIDCSYPDSFSSSFRSSHRCLNVELFDVEFQKYRSSRSLTWY